MHFLFTVMIAFAVLAYVVLDGFDLGIGMLFAFFRARRERDVLTNTVAPVWDGNETWLVLGGGGLFAAFSLAYAILLPAFYAPLDGMLLALVFRGVAFEFRHRDRAGTSRWDLAFSSGSTVATLCQGVVLGAFVQGVSVRGRAYAGGWFEWLTPFSVMTGCALVAGYALLGATWLIYKTEGDIQARCFRLARPLALVVVGFIGLVSLWTPLLDADIAERGFSWPNMAWLAPVPLLVAALAVSLLGAIARRRELAPILLALGLFALSYAGLGISLYPYVVPRSITIWQGAAPDASLGFLLVGAAILLPVVLAYTVSADWVFRGKVGVDEGYH